MSHRAPIKFAFALRAFSMEKNLSQTGIALLCNAFPAWIEEGCCLDVQALIVAMISLAVKFPLQTNTVAVWNLDYRRTSHMHDDNNRM